uniref:Putative secreted protein n=1 Tax=Amblyomma cajennense TaxID=34607 RepID=A0A023FDB2_AMBCJ
MQTMIVNGLLFVRVQAVSMCVLNCEPLCIPNSHCTLILGQALKMYTGQMLEHQDVHNTCIQQNNSST